jgi:Ca-activated chloride channel family protein
MYNEEMNALRCKALIGFMVFLSLGCTPWARAQDPPTPQTTIRAEVSLVNVIFTAVDKKKRAVPGLKKENFLIYEDKKPQEILYFSEMTETSEVPLTIALLIDTSGSVKTKLDYEKETAAEFFRTVLRPDRDLAMIIQFDSEINLVQDFTSDLDRLIGALGTLRAGNSTSLYDAIYVAVEDKLKYEVGRKVMVVITDGTDTASKLPKEAALETAQRHDVLIYGIGVRGDMGSSFKQLKKFAEETGGNFFSPRAKFKEIQAAFQSIGEELKGQYSLAYRSTNRTRDGKFRALRLRCTKRGVKIRTRKGYYAPRAARP